MARTSEPCLMCVLAPPDGEALGTGESGLFEGLR